MGKRIIPRARGAGGPRYRAPSHRFLGKVEYLPDGAKGGVVLDIVKDAIHSAPMALIRGDGGRKILQIAAEGLHTGDQVRYGAEATTGNVVPLSSLSEGMRAFCIETYPGSGPKLCRSSGTSVLVLGKSGDKVALQFVTGKVKEFDERCRVTVGVAAGSGRTDKPWISVGQKYKAKHAVGKLFPRSAGVAMTATDHPYGGRSKRPRPSRTVSRHASPGSKVGSIAARRVGIRKGAKKLLR